MPIIGEKMTVETYKAFSAMKPFGRTRQDFFNR